MSDQTTKSALFQRLTTEIGNYLSLRVEISEGVYFSQYQLIKRLMKFKNRDLAGRKIGEDLRYNYYYDIISPRVDNEVKNLRFDTKNVLAFSRNPTQDFAAVFILNAKLKEWMAEHGEDEKLKSAVDEFVGNGNVLFKKVAGGYETTDPLNTYITNQRAKTIADTDVVERHEMTASQLKSMTAWEYVDEVIRECGNNSFAATSMTAPSTTTGKRYEVFEFTGEVSEREFNEVKQLPEGDEHKYFLAKVIVAGLKKGKAGQCYALFAEKLPGTMEDYYLDAHRGRYEGRYWRTGMYEQLFDHQIRANEIGNDIARGLEWASKVIFRSKDSKVLQNIRADMDNGDVVITDDLAQVDVRLHNLDQLIADWNRLMVDADRLANSAEVVRGEAPPSGTPFRTTSLLDANAGKLFVAIRQKITLPYKRVFREWVLPRLVRDLRGEEIFRLVGDTEIIDQFREVAVNSWYTKNLVRIGPHTREVAAALKAEKLDELRNVDPAIKNSKEIWKDVLKRLFITITGENFDGADNVQDMVSLLNLEQDPERIAWMLDRIYKIRGIPVPPKREEQAPDPLMLGDQQTSAQPEPQRPARAPRRQSRSSYQEPAIE